MPMLGMGRGMGYEMRVHGACGLLLGEVRKLLLRLWPRSPIDRVARCFRARQPRPRPSRKERPVDTRSPDPEHHS